MIKVTVHESVESALQKAFPRPAASAARALAKYVAVVEAMLFDALQHGRTPEKHDFHRFPPRSRTLSVPSSAGRQKSPTSADRLSQHSEYSEDRKRAL